MAFRREAAHACTRPGLLVRRYQPGVRLWAQSDSLLKYVPEL